eukprot:8765125-Pyramimonas_sp.AAC.1
MRNIAHAARSAWIPSIAALMLDHLGRGRIAIARAAPPRPRCRRAACRRGVTRALATLSHARASPVNS